MRFYSSQERPNLPIENDIDWQYRLEQKYDNLPPVMMFDSGDGLVQPLSQSNCNVFMSNLDDPTDCITVDDPRDEMKFAFFREQMEDFDKTSQLLQNMGSCAVHLSLYPLEEIVAIWLNKQSRDLSKDEIPKEWFDGKIE